MTFDIATSADLGDGNRRLPYGRSLAGEVLKKKLQLRKNAIPPPTLQISNYGDSSSSFTTQSELNEDSDSDSNYTTNISPPTRSSDAFGSAISNKRATSTVLEGQLNPVAVFSASEMRTKMAKLLVQNPQLQPYLKYKLPLERKGIKDYSLPHSSMFFESSCQTCLHHGDICTIDNLEPSSKCLACTQFGGRCIFRNLEGPAIPRYETHFLCGRCALGMNKDHEKEKHIPDLPFSPSKALHGIFQAARSIGKRIETEEEPSEGLQSTELETSSTISQRFPILSAVEEAFFEEATGKLDQSHMANNAHQDDNQLHISEIADECPSKEGLFLPSLSVSRLRSKQRQCTAAPSVENTSSATSSESFTGDRRCSNSDLKTALVASDPETSLAESLNQYPDEVVPSRRSRNKKSRRPSIPSQERTSFTNCHSAEPQQEPIFRYPTSLPTRSQNRRLFQPDATLQRSALETTQHIDKDENDNEIPAPAYPWRSRRIPKWVPLTPAKPLFGPKSENEKLLDAVRDIAQKIYIRESEDGWEAITIDRGMREALDMREARKQLQKGFEEPQGGEIIVRGVQVSTDVEEVEALAKMNASAAYWEKRMRKEHAAFEGSFWDYHGCKHRK